MGRTIPSFRIALEMEEKEEWKPFRNALDKSEERKKFDKMWELPKFYISACSNSVQLGALHPIIISILFTLLLSSHPRSQYVLKDIQIRRAN
jgi:hypothetical protein